MSTCSIRSSAQGHGESKAVRRAASPAGCNERDVGRGQGEEPEQLLAADLGELAQGLEFLVDEDLSDQPAPSPQPEDPQFRSLADHMRPKFPGYSGDPFRVVVRRASCEVVTLP